LRCLDAGPSGTGKALAEKIAITLAACQAVGVAGWVERRPIQGFADGGGKENPWSAEANQGDIFSWSTDRKAGATWRLG